MPTFEVDDQLHAHPKAAIAGDEALGLWVRAGSWCAAYLTDGRVPLGQAMRLGADIQWDRLVEAGLVDRTEDGFELHDYLHWNRPAAFFLAKRAKDTRRKYDQRSHKRAESKLSHDMSQCDMRRDTARDIPCDTQQESHGVSQGVSVDPHPLPLSLLTEEATGVVTPEANAAFNLETRQPEPSKRTRRRKPKQESLTPKAPVGKAWALWRDVYASSRRAYGSYVSTPACNGAMQRLAERARDEAIAELARRGTQSEPFEVLALEILRHWFVSFLRDDGRNNYLADKRHPITCLQTALVEYGTPWSKAQTVDPQTAKANYEAMRAGVCK